jgi:tetratricopeptide (TPR) repeat protein
MKGAWPDMKRIRGIIRTAVILVPLILVLMPPAPGAKAQGADDVDKVRSALERTDQVIGDAKMVIEQSRSQKGRLALDVAAGVQTRAWGNFGGHGYRMALRLTMEAREEAWHAIALARSDRQFEDSHIRMAEEARERLARLRDLVIESGARDEHAMRLMEQARMLLDKSRLNAQQLRYQLALKLAADARELTIKAEERLRNTRAIKEAAERRLALLERLIERSRERVQQHAENRSHSQLSAAEEQIEKARGFLNDGRYREAQQALERCEKTLRNSVRLLPAVAAGDPQDQLDEAYRLLERAVEISSDDPASAATLAAGRASEGTELIRQARERLRSAVNTGARGLTRERLMLRIEKVEALREETRNLAEKCPHPGVKELMERAQEHLRLARVHTESGNLESAIAETAVARNLYQRIGELCAR